MGNSSHATFPSLAKTSSTTQPQRLDEESSDEDDYGSPPSPQDLALAEAFNTPDWNKLAPGAAQAAEAWAEAQQVGQPPLTTVSGSEAAMQEASSANGDKREVARKLITAGSPPNSEGTTPRRFLQLRSHNKKKAHRKARLRKSQKAATHNQRSKLTGNEKVRESMTDTNQLLTSNGMLTWYAGGQLLNPACGGAAPTDDSLVGAVTKTSSLGSCGDQINLTYNGNSVTVTIRDWCASCSDNHVDVTKGVFKQLAPLDVGVLKGVIMVSANDGSN